MAVRTWSMFWIWSALPDDEPRAQAHDIYEWIGALQETLVDALG
jgi:hypothetical protein